MAVAVAVCSDGAYAFETRNWVVDGLPADADGRETVELPANPDAARRILAHKLENFGYPLARVDLVEERLVITYGTVTAIDVSALDEAVRPLIGRYLGQLVGTSPTTDRLDQVITRINDIAGFTGSILLQPGTAAGEYTAVAAGEMRRQSGVLSVRNTPTQNFDTRDVSLHQSFYSLLTSGDVLRIDLNGGQTSAGSTAYAGQISHQFPVNDTGTFAETRLSHFDASSDLPNEPGQTTDSKSTSGALVLGQSFSRYLDSANYLYSELNYRRDSGSTFENTEHAVLRTVFVETHTYDAGANFTWGVGLSAGTETTDNDVNFGIARGGLGFLLWLPEPLQDVEMRIENSWQISSSKTPAYELHSFDGVSRQRGFAPYEYAGNHGADVTVEVAKTFTPWAENGPLVAPFAFVDASYLANTSGNVAADRPGNTGLVSAGVGSTVSFANGFSLVG